MRTLRMAVLAVPAMVALGILGCSNGDPNALNGSLGGGAGGAGDPYIPGAGGTGGGGTGGGTGGGIEEPSTQLDMRRRDYGESLRSASLKLVGEIPTLAEINTIANATSEAQQKTVYEGHVDRLIADPRFTKKMVTFWRDTLRIAQTGAVQNGLNKDFAANFAALVTVQGRSYNDLFTATTGTCPTYDATTNTLTAADCAANGAAPVVGLITDRGVQSHYFASMAFRRVRFLQESFVCTKYPAEFSEKGTAMGGGVYTSPWPFATVTGGAGSKVDFQDTKSVVCANCHTTMNHIAPLFANFDGNGAYMATSQVEIPIPGAPKAAIGDWLTAGNQGLAWRMSKPITDLPSLGKAMSEDPDVAACAVTRAWNYAFSRGDVVGDLAAVPAPVIKAELDAFRAGGMKFKDSLARIFKSDDFTMW